MAMLLTLVGVALSSLLLPTVIIQIGSTRQELQRTQALHAAMAGTDVAIGHIRAAVAADGRTGDLTKLPPCEGTLSGGVGSGAASYQVTIHYLTVDPQGKSEQWATANAMCSSGTPTSTPTYALIIAKGYSRDPAEPGANRTVRATYAFHTTNSPPPGGLIHVFKSGFWALDLCLDAGPSPWAANRSLTMQRCAAAGSPQQTFAYNRDLTLQLVSSKTALLPGGLCLDAGAAHAVNNPVRLQNCMAVAPAAHKWSLNGSSNFEGTTNGTTADGYCFNVQSPGWPGSPVVLGVDDNGTCIGPPDNKQSFSPDARAGAGMANPPNATGQLVNFEQFGRCMDIPGGHVSDGFLIAWPCKQAPDGSYVGWNQVWFQPALSYNTATCGAQATPCGKGTITVVAPAGKASPVGTYCLQSPGSTAPGLYVNAIDMCPGGAPPAKMTWTVYGETHDPDTRYHIMDYRGFCLAPSTTNLYGTGTNVGKIVMVPCAESPLQMWNAPANAGDPLPLKDVSEQ